MGQQNAGCAGYSVVSQSIMTEDKQLRNLPAPSSKFNEEKEAQWRRSSSFPGVSVSLRFTLCLRNTQIFGLKKNKRGASSGSLHKMLYVL